MPKKHSKNRRAKKVAHDLKFNLNGNPISIARTHVDPSMRLVEYLRTQTRYTGTKLSCGEGGCGACAVVLTSPSGESYSVNSCLRPLAACDGYSVTTTEGLGSQEKGLHPLQERIAAFNGLQCGFCTPGFVMAMYGTLQGGDKTMAELEDSLDGNICRCTGYRPILDWAKSFAVDTSVTDTVTDGKAATGTYDHAAHDPTTESVSQDNSKTKTFEKHGTQWIRPTSLLKALAVLKRFHGDDTRVRVVAGHTGAAFEDGERFDVLVDIHRLPELQGVTMEAQGMRVGAAVTLSELYQSLTIHAASSASFGTLSNVIKRVANTHVRNVGTLAGNLMLRKTRDFRSDMAPSLLVLQATVTLVTASKTACVEHEMPLSEFLSSRTLPAGFLLHSVFIPFLAPSQRYAAFKSATRQRNAVADVNAAFRLDLSGATITNATVECSGLKHARKIGEGLGGFLCGKTLSPALLKGAMEKLVSLTDKSEERMAAHGARVLAGFLYKFLLDCFPAADVPPTLTSARASAKPTRPLTSGSQTFQRVETQAPVHKAISEVSGQLKATGQARFVDDIPTQMGTLFAHHVTASEGRALLTALDPAPALGLPGVERFVGASDIPGKNNSSTWGDNTPLFVAVGTEVSFHGQSLGLILADTPAHARAGARAVVAAYDRQGLAPVLTTEEAVANAVAEGREKEAVIGTHEFKRGDTKEADGKDTKGHKISGNIFMASQQHFYMEPQTSYAIPDEDGRMKVHCSLQFPGHTAQAVAAVLGQKKKDVNVVHRRAGGAFGGKLVHHISHACAVAVAARASGVPVRMAVARDVDSRQSGGREEVSTEYHASFDDQGVVTAVDFHSRVNAGFCKGLAWFGNMTLAHASNQCYDWKHYSHVADMYNTNLPGRTPMRAPGDVQATYVAETVIDHVAQTLGLSPETVRERNFYPMDAEADAEALKLPIGLSIGHWTLPRLWPLLGDKVGIADKHAACLRFNQENRWRKRGAAMVPIRYQVSVWPRQALVNIYDDGSVLVTQDGSELGQGLYTKVLQATAHALSELAGEGFVPMEQIRMADLSTHVVPNGTFTGGSTGSEGACQAARDCCAQLLDRLRPVYDELCAAADDKAPPTWNDVIAAANGKSVHLSAVARWAGGGEQSLTYQNFGVAASVVEVDVITGELSILSSDLVYDCGQSLNPAIDLGQAEGAFVMGLGFFFTEESLVCPDNGELLSTNTWHYKPPLAFDIPINFTVEFLQDSGFDKGILSSKCSGEPPLCMASSAMMAVKQAIYAARKDAGLLGFIQLNTPATPVDIAKACGTDTTHFHAL